jgi:hypothetical protein
MKKGVPSQAANSGQECWDTKPRCSRSTGRSVLDALVPPDNFYRELEVKLDLTFVRDLVRDHYASRMGRPSIDPVVFFKLQLISFLRASGLNAS